MARKKWNCSFKPRTKEYHKWYKRNVIGLNPNPKTYTRLRCLVCGMLVYPHNLKRDFDPLVKLQRGYRLWWSLDSPTLSNVRGLVQSDAIEKHKWLAKKCLSVLKRLRDSEFISNDEIKTYLNLVDIPVGNRLTYAASVSPAVLLPPLVTLPNVEKIKPLEEVSYGWRC